MKYRAFGNTSWNLSEIGFGGWAIGGGWGQQDDGDSLKALHHALDAGVNFIDTAAGYGGGHSERLIGQALKERSDKETVRVATKIPLTGKGPWPPSPWDRHQDRLPESYLRENMEERLRCLGTECIDLVQLHTWTRAWNRDPRPLEVLQEMKKEGKLRAVGISTPEHDQNCAIGLMRDGLIDSLQVIYNIFEQEPAAELFPVAEETNTAIIVRVAFDEGVLTGKYNADFEFPEGDFRRNYFAGDRLERSVRRVERIRESLAEIPDYPLDLPQTALKFALAHPAVSTVIPGMRNMRQVELNTAAPDLPDIPDEAMQVLKQHMWRRAFWYGGK